MSEFGYRIGVVWSPEDECYVASVPSLGVLAHGRTAAVAVKEARIAGELMLASLIADEQAVPPLDAGRSCSGNIRLRIPRSLHHRLAELAQDEGVSLNTLMVSLLAFGVGERPASKQRRLRSVSSATGR
ncbi:MAG: type II toxin-antitoxin system HicB family antitoxin [Deltaproteobacteria bacterium]|jgi:predicted HicB family RNase H-like nuclease|nr:type II toxin-antitoxin system HicB family antitoxin [Deltaproteobacteria bacterium]